MRPLRAQLNLLTQIAPLLLFALVTSIVSMAQQKPRTILAIGAHAADITSGARLPWPGAAVPPSWFGLSNFRDPEDVSAPLTLFE